VDEIKKTEDELDDVTGMSGLLKACESGNEVTATHFLSAPYFANVRKTCKSGATPLFYAAANGHPRIIDLLHSRQADLNARVPPVCNSVNTSRIIAGQTPLCIAAKFGHTECVRRLLQLRADASMRNSRGQTALDIASEDSSGLAEKLPQWSETPRVHQFRSCVELLRDAMYPNQVPGGGGFGGQFDATGAST
jgi:ankyrin repeat protein